MIKNVFFDFNGTLLDDLDLCCEIEFTMMSSYGLKPYTMKEYCDKFYFPVKNYYHDVGFKDEDYPMLAEFFMKSYSERWLGETKLFSGCKDALLNLKKKGYKLYCLSATKYGLLKEQLKFLNILECFDDICGARDNMAHGKIDYGKAFIFEHKIDPAETIMVGDTEHDYETADALGFKCIMFSKGHCSRWRLEKLPCPICDSYSQIVEEISKSF